MKSPHEKVLKAHKKEPLEFKVTVGAKRAPSLMREFKHEKKKDG